MLALLAACSRKPLAPHAGGDVPEGPVTETTPETGPDAPEEPPAPGTDAGLCDRTHERATITVQPASGAGLSCSVGFADGGASQSWVGKVTGSDANTNSNTDTPSNTNSTSRPHADPR